MTAAPKCKESAYRKYKEREEFGCFDHKFFYHHALYVGYNVKNVLCNTMKQKGGLAHRNILANTFPRTLENTP